MKNDLNVRSNFLDKANGATSILAILSAVAAFPGGLKVYQFMMDASDSKIEQSNLTGLGDMTIPGLGYALKEPYSSLVLFTLAVIIPIVLLIVLIVKKSGLSNNKIVGRGLYWLIVLLGIGGILGGLGILTKLFSNNLGAIFDIKTDPSNLAIVIGSVLAVITAWFAINFLSQARKAADADDPTSMIDVAEYHDEIDKDGYVEDDSIMEKSGLNPQIIPVESELTEIVTESPSAPAEEAVYDRSFVAQPVEVTPPDPATIALDPLLPVETLVSSEAVGLIDPVLADPVDGYVPEVPVDQDTQVVQETQVIPMVPGVVISSSVSPDQPLDSKLSKPAENGMKPVLKRKLIAFPGEDTKVILVMREYLQDELIREWAEIHLKSEFTKKG